MHELMLCAHLDLGFDHDDIRLAPDMLLHIFLFDLCSEMSVAAVRNDFVLQSSLGVSHMLRLCSFVAEACHCLKAVVFHAKLPACGRGRLVARFAEASPITGYEVYCFGRPFDVFNFLRCLSALFSIILTSLKCAPVVLRGQLGCRSWVIPGMFFVRYWVDST